MSERITRAMIDSALREHNAALESIGYVGKLAISPGSVTNGNPWELFELTPGRNTPPVGSTRLGGRSIREAYESLTLRTRCIYDVARIMRSNRDDAS